MNLRRLAPICVILCFYRVCITGVNITGGNCTSPSCPVDGGWSSWEGWGPCFARCGGKVGIRRRDRTCTNPPKANGGEQCPGAQWQNVFHDFWGMTVDVNCTSPLCSELINTTETTPTTDEKDGKDYTFLIAFGIPATLMLVALAAYYIRKKCKKGAAKKASQESSKKNPASSGDKNSADAPAKDGEDAPADDADDADAASDKTKSSSFKSASDKTKSSSLKSASSGKSASVKT